MWPNIDDNLDQSLFYVSLGFTVGILAYNLYEMI